MKLLDFVDIYEQWDGLLLQLYNVCVHDLLHFPQYYVVDIFYKSFLPHF